MEIHDNGGPFFPRPDLIEVDDMEEVHGFSSGDAGLSLWDYYFGLAMQGLLAADTEFYRGPHEIAKYAANQADIMVEQRKYRMERGS